MIAPFAGLAAIVLPVLINPSVRWYSAETIAPPIRTGVENLSIEAVVLLFVAGAVVAPPRIRSAWLVGACTVAALPLITIFELFRFPASHNLWPLEFVVYGFLAIPGMLGALAGAFMKRRPVG